MILYFGEKVRQIFLNQLINRARKFFTERHVFLILGIILLNLRVDASVTCTRGCWRKHTTSIHDVPECSLLITMPA